MAHFAKLNFENEVLDILVVSNDDIQNLPFPDSEPLGIEFLTNLFFNKNCIWKQTSYNNNFRCRYARIGEIYDPVNDVFMHKQPYPSWLLNTNVWIWEPPIVYPTDGKFYIWDESTISWIEK